MCGRKKENENFLYFQFNFPINLKLSKISKTCVLKDGIVEDSETIMTDWHLKKLDSQIKNQEPIVRKKPNI